MAASAFARYGHETAEILVLQDFVSQVSPDVLGPLAVDCVDRAVEKIQENMRWHQENYEQVAAWLQNYGS